LVAAGRILKGRKTYNGQAWKPDLLRGEGNPRSGLGKASEGCSRSLDEVYSESFGKLKINSPEDSG
jgi:hypothetical protein